MSRKQKPAFSWSSGNITGSQVVIGDGNVITIAQNERKVLQRQFSAIKKNIKKSAPPDKQDEALRKVAELQGNVLSDKPDPSSMARIRDWFVKHLPGIAGAVTGTIVNPIVGKLVEAAGDAVAGEFKRRFGVSS